MVGCFYVIIHETRIKACTTRRAWFKPFNPYESNNPCFSGMEHRFFSQVKSFPKHHHTKNLLREPDHTIILVPSGFVYFIDDNFKAFLAPKQETAIPYKCFYFNKQVVTKLQHGIVVFFLHLTSTNNPKIGHTELRTEQKTSYLRNVFNFHESVLH